LTKFGQRVNVEITNDQATLDWRGKQDEDKKRYFEWVSEEN
jgi:hypothetical protein